MAGSGGGRSTGPAEEETTLRVPSPQAPRTATPDGSARLVGRIAAGDAAAERELVERLGRGVEVFLRRLTRDREQAGDLYQETFRIVISSLRQGRLDQPEKLAAFVRGTAKNLLRSEWRKRDRRGPHDDLDGMVLSDPRPGPAARAQLEQDRRRVRQLLDELRSERDRQILYRHYWREESKDEICAVLGIGSSQYNLVLFRARQRFRQLLERAEGQPPGRGPRREK